jgi:hypothetical protein
MQDKKDLHPDIKKYWENEGYQISIWTDLWPHNKDHIRNNYLHPYQNKCLWLLLPGTKDTIALYPTIAVLTLSGEMLYTISDQNIEWFIVEPLTEEQMLRHIKLKAFQ